MTNPVNFNELLEGASIQQIAQLLDRDRATVRRLIERSGIKSCGVRKSHPIYKFSEVAPHVAANPKKRRDGSKTTDVNWGDKLKEQKYLENNGDLWRTEKVVESYIAVFKFFRETVTVFNDRIEHETQIPDAAVDKIKHFSDLLLNDTREKILGADFDHGKLETPKPESFVADEENDTDDELGI